MSLLELYKNRNSNEEWFKSHSSLGKGSYGRLFEYTNTNFRKQKSFANHFVTFQEVENVSRDNWPQSSHGQEKHKHMVVNMIQSKLYRQDQSGLFSKTVKGQLYKKFIESERTEDERWLINYLFLINGYYFSQKNYIVYRVREDLLGFMLSVDGVDEDFLINSAKELLKTSGMNEVLRSPFFYIHSFYNDTDFLISYVRSSNEEREALAEYIENNLADESFRCCISKKYQSSGNFDKGMLYDETKVFLLTLLFIKTKNVRLDNVPSIFVDTFNTFIASIDKKEVLTYLKYNKNVFDPIFCDVLEVEEDNQESSESGITERDEIEQVDRPEDYIDETSEDGKQQIKVIYNLRKRQARIQSNYKCCLETVNNCRPIYFTSKSNGKNYLELHHFIPQEFRNDFSHSIEVLANYVTLCPRCHRQIHLATDRERKALINYIFEERKARLETVGLSLDFGKIYKYYKIDS